MRLRQVKSIKNPRYVLETKIEEFLSAIEKNDFLEHPTEEFNVAALLSDEKHFPKELHLLFWLEVVLRMNDKTQENFHKRINRENGDLRGKDVSLIGVGYSRRFGQVTESPALNLIEWLINSKKVRHIIISDPDAEAAFDEWKQLHQRTDLEGKIIFDPSIYSAVKRGEITIIATDSNEEINRLDPNLFAEAAQGKIVFDGINLLGLRSDGKQIYSLSQFNGRGFKYVGVGRPYELTDSVIYTPQNYPVKEFRQKRVAVIGGGYVGLVTAANLAALGHKVHVVEIDPEKVRKLNEEDIQVPIYEPGLKEMILAGKKQGLITFSSNAAKAVQDSTMVYLAVGTPQSKTGAIDLEYIRQATTVIGEAIKAGAGAKDIIVKSTVTPNTFEVMDLVLHNLGLTLGKDYSLASNPEFLKEGTAIEDVTKPDRTVLGIYSKMREEARIRLANELLELYQPILQANNAQVFVVTDTASSTLIKYAANAFLAVSISLSNFLARDSEYRGASYREVAEVLRRDERIKKFSFLEPGCGYGGSCFPKDVLAVANESIAYTGDLIGTVLLADQSNDLFQVDSVHDVLNSITEFPNAPNAYRGMTVPLLGVTFKPKTDDMRQSPTLSMVYELLKLGASKVIIQDPIFTLPDAPLRQDLIRNFYQRLYDVYQEKGAYQGLNFEAFYEAFNKEYGSRLEFADTPEQAVLSDAQSVKVIFIPTNWPQYKNINFARMNLAPRTLIYDQRGVLTEDQIQTILDAGLRYKRIGQVLKTGPGRSELRDQTAASIPAVVPRGSTESLREQVLSAPNLTGKDIERFVPPAYIETGKTAQKHWDFSKVSGDIRLSVAKAVLIPEAFAATDDNPVRDAIWNSLSEDTRKNLFEGTDGHRVHLISVAEPENIPPGIAVFLETAHKDDLMTVVLNQELSADAAALLKVKFLEAYSLQSRSENFNLIGLRATQTKAQAVLQVVTDPVFNRNRAVGIVDSTTELFKELNGKVPASIIDGQARAPQFFWMGEGRDINTGILLSPLALRQQVSDKFSLRNLTLELQGRFNLNQLTAQIALLVQTVQHLATQA